MARLWTRAIRPPSDEIPNSNDPADVPPATVGPPAAVPGDPSGVVMAGDDPPAWVPPRIRPSAWSGWPEDWQTPNWGGTSLQQLTDVAWMCVDRNANVLAEMPPYLVNAAPSLNADWLNNPQPDIYASWEEFCKQLFWDWQLGEVFVLTTARYATGLPARFHVVPGWTVNVEMDSGSRFYSIGNVDVTPDILHIRYQGTTTDAHGHGPLEAGAYRLVAANMLMRYASGIASAGGVPASILEHPEELSPEQAQTLKAEWVASRMTSLGEPAVLSGGIQWKPTQMNPKDMALIDLAQMNDSRIAALLSIPPELVGLPGAGDSLTYSTALMARQNHWSGGLRPFASQVMSALSGFALPRGTRVELNRNSYIEPDLLAQAQTVQILASIVDPDTGKPAMTVAEIRAALRLDNSTPADLSAGVLR